MVRLLDGVDRLERVGSLGADIALGHCVEVVDVGVVVGVKLYGEKTTIQALSSLDASSARGGTRPNPLVGQCVTPRSKQVTLKNPPSLILIGPFGLPGNRCLRHSKKEIAL